MAVEICKFFNLGLHPDKKIFPSYTGFRREKRNGDNKASLSMIVQKSTKVAALRGRTRSSTYNQRVIQSTPSYWLKQYN